MQEHVIPKREDVPEEFTWNLGDMFESDEAWSAELEAAQELPVRAAAFAGRLCESAQTLYEYLRLEDEAGVRLSMLYGYASCKSDQDTANAFYQDMRGKAMSLYVAYAGAGAFATPEIIAVDDERFESFYKDEPRLETYRRVLYRVRRMAEHVLSEAEERLLAAAGEMAASPDNIRSIFMNADISFPPVKDADGNEHTLTNETFVPMLEGADRMLRKTAFETYYARLGEFKNTIAAALDGQFKQLRFFGDDIRMLKSRMQR